MKTLIMLVFVTGALMLLAGPAIGQNAVSGKTTHSSNIQQKGEKVGIIIINGMENDKAREIDLEKPDFVQPARLNTQSGETVQEHIPLPERAIDPADNSKPKR